MKYISEFRSREQVKKWVDKIHEISTREISLMEVCGGHTMAIQKFGIPAILPENIKLKSGPGCPVCVSSRGYIDRAIALARITGNIITTYGDLIRVPGSSSTLEKERADGKDIRIVYSVLDAMQIARENKNNKIIFLGIGFETTAPSSAVAVKSAFEEGLDNFFLYSAHKVMPPAMRALVDEGIRLDGYIGPGHVSAITGSFIYDFLPEKFGVGCVISGFEPIDILQSIYMLVRQVEDANPAVEIQYKRAVVPEGNTIAQALMNEVFELRSDWWRGLDILPESGMGIRTKYASYDAENAFDVEVEEIHEDKRCICGEILKGIKDPRDCRLFGNLCNPENPVGACMVSHEGACHAHYRYNYEA
ncbi:hydrogenase formation protein HypD [Bacteroidota bacterium]